MNVNKHGNPGVGVTGKDGLIGKSGNSFYFGTLDSYFTYIGKDTIQDISIDYDDIDYDITYAEDEERLDIKYNEGDILYILSDESVNAEILYFVELTEDMTTCTKKYFLEHIKHNNPFQKKFNHNNQMLFPVNIVKSNMENPEYIFNICQKHKNGNINAIESFEGVQKTVSNIGTDNEVIKNTYQDIPSRYNKDNSYKHIINNGANIHKFTIDTSLTNTANFITCKLYDQENVQLSVSGEVNSHINIKSDNLYIDNLYIKNNNLGNIEAKNTLYTPELVLDEDGNCYTLTLKDYNSETESFIFDTSNFFKNKNIDKNNYHFGYIHKYWNYNENLNDDLDSSYYKPNYITGTIVEYDEKKVRQVMRDEVGNYIRDWNNKQYNSINDIYVRQALIYALDISTLADVSNILNESVASTTYEKYKNYNGIIMTEETYVNRIYDYVQLLDGRQYRTYRNDDACTGFYVNSSIIEKGPINQFIDTSFYSDITICIDPSLNNISLSKYDKTASLYRHHEIVLWVSTPDGLKYYSKPTKLNYDYQSNTFLINTTYKQNDVGKANIMTDIINELFAISFDNSNEENDTIIIKTLNNHDNTITKLQIYENGALIGWTHVSNTTDTYKFDITKHQEPEITLPTLDQIYKGSFINLMPEPILYTIKYAEHDAAECTNILTYKRNVGGYIENRKFPNIQLKSYNSMEILEKCNNITNGILTNHFSTFIDLQIDNFVKETWGTLEDIYPNIKLQFDLKLYTMLKCANGTENGVTTDDYKITVALITPDIDVLNTSLKDLMQFDHKDITSDNYILPCEFTIEQACKGIYKLHIFIETANPVPAYGTISANVNMNSITIVHDNGIERCTIDDIVKCETIKFAIAPLSYIASYKQTNSTDKISNIGRSKWYGSDDVINIVLKPYGLDLLKPVPFSKDRMVNWNSIKFKRRYLQDNVKTLSIFAININELTDLIPDKMYNKDTLAKDNDDIFSTYLEFIYNSKYLNPYHMNDEYQFQYNNRSYLASCYGQFENNTAVYVTQENELQIRNLTLLNSMQTWNKEYEIAYRYESDNPYPGHLSTYGNGYQYLPNSADTDQFTQYSVMSLNDIKLVNEEEFISNDNYFETNCNMPAKMDNYTPNILFRSLLYDLQWVYPKYYSSEGINYIKRLHIKEASLYSSENEPDSDIMPYNLCYTLTPRILYNDEEQTNIVLMLRKPTVVNETKESLDVSDVCLQGVSSIETLNDIINVMN